jgi:hypothetical protein
MASVDAAMDWKSVALSPTSSHLIWLLKKDGTLWQWGVNRTGHGRSYESIRTSAPVRLGDDSDWESMRQGHPEGLLLWERNGSCWTGVQRTDFALKPEKVELGPGHFIRRFPPLDKIIPRSFTRSNLGEAIVRPDGTLWTYGHWAQMFRGAGAEMEGYQFGGDTNWVSVADSRFGGFGIEGLKADGSLWKWRRTREGAFLTAVQMGRRSDWVAIASSRYGGGMLSLAADGTLWHWDLAPGYPRGWLGLRGPWLGPSRFPVRLGEMFTVDN